MTPVVIPPSGYLRFIILGPHARGLVAVVDPVDYDAVAAFSWTAEVRVRSNGESVTYASRRASRRPDGKRPKIYLHRMIAERIAGRPLEEGTVVDHRDRDGLNCRRGNLRPTRQSYNAANRDFSSQLGEVPLIGVVRTAAGLYQARVKVDGRRIDAGTYASQYEAARARDVAAREVWGEFAVLNFSDDGPF